MAKAKNAQAKRRIRKADDSSSAAEVTQESKKGIFGRYFASFSFIFQPLKPFFNYLKRLLLFLVPRYFVNSWREVKQVSWPKRGETWRLTLAVFVFATIFGTLVAIVDKGLDEIFKKVVLR